MLVDKHTARLKKVCTANAAATTAAAATAAASQATSQIDHTGEI